MRSVVLGGENGAVTVLIPRDGKLEEQNSFQGPGGRVQSVAVGTDDTWAALGTQTGTMEIRSLPVGELLASIRGHRGSVDSIALARNGSLLATGCADGLIRLFDLSSPSSVSLRFTLRPRMGAIDTLRLSQDGRWLAAFARNSREIRVWDLDALTREILTLLGI